MDDIYNDDDRSLPHHKDNEFVGRIKVVRKVRRKEKVKEPKPEEIFDMTYKDGGEVKMSKRKKEKVVMPYMKKNHRTQDIEPNVPQSVYRMERKRKPKPKKNKCGKKICNCKK